MKKTLLALAVASLAVLAMAATVAAAGPSGVAIRERAQAQAHDAIPSILDLTTAEIADLRQEGLSLAQIAARQQVDPQELVDALMTRWEARIQARVELGALTPDEATQLRTRLETRARDLVFKVTTGGMQGTAVGAGPSAAANGASNGAGNGAVNGTAGSGDQTRQRAGAAGQNGDGTCDGSGDGRQSGAGNGAGRP